jgi:regulatory protein
MKPRKAKELFVFEEGKEKLLMLKLEQYCAYTERCTADVVKKCREWKVPPEMMEQLLTELRENNFLNDERYGEAFARGKFRLKGWGKNKIKAALQTKSVQQETISSALQDIDADEYFRKMDVLLQKKNLLLKETDPYKRRTKLFQYAAQKGYEAGLILQWLDEQLKEKNAD